MKEDIKKLFFEMVKIDSESGSERKFADWLKNYLEKLGADEIIEDENVRKNVAKDLGVDEENTSGTIIARFKGKKDNWIMLNAHIDTVVNGKNIEPVLLDDNDTVVSKGDTILGADDKAGVAIILYVLENREKFGLDNVSIEAVFTPAEEVGLYGSKFLSVELKSKIGLVFDSEANVGTVDNSAPYHWVWKCRIIGKESHAGVVPEQGLSAIVGASKAVNSLKWGRIDEETTCNVGKIKGGKANNIVAGECEITGEARSRDKEKVEKIMKDIKEAFLVLEKEGYKVEFEEKLEYAGYKHDLNDGFFEVLKRAAKNCGLEFNTKPTGGGSDTNNFNNKGLKAFNLGIEMKKVHTTSEYIKLSSIEKAIKFVIEILKEFK